MKHISLHLLENFPTGWIADCTHVHLIRHPVRVVASYGDRREGITAHDIGFREQAEIYHKTGGIVIDSADLRADPQRMLTRLCTALGLPFDPVMLYWSKGGHQADGAWALHWYKALHGSSGFAGPEGPLPRAHRSRRRPGRRSVAALRGARREKDSRRLKLLSCVLRAFGIPA